MIHKHSENKKIPTFRELVERLRKFSCHEINKTRIKEIQEIIQEAPSLKARTGLALSLILARSPEFFNGTGLDEEVIIDRICILTLMEREDPEIMVPYILHNLPHAARITVPSVGVWKEP